MTWTKIEPQTEGGGNSETWKPEKEGDTIEGILMETKTNVGKNKSNIYMLLTDNGEVGVWGGTVIDSRLKDIPDDGAERIKIEFLGWKEGANGQYRDFDVFHKPSGE
ncbi:hypothetical protein LCGC14_1473670 [marine sediment metagenome]|uniref:Uncharacterized protein n=1 Tax=marine sediment metagenome TaxID=412755 RepID=A0A0F9LS20_9ZZZZ